MLMEEHGCHDIYFGKLAGQKGYHLLVDGDEYLPPLGLGEPSVKRPTVSRRRFHGFTLQVKDIGAMMTVEDYPGKR